MKFKVSTIEKRIIKDMHIYVHVVEFQYLLLLPSKEQILARTSESEGGEKKVDLLCSAIHTTLVEEGYNKYTH